MRQISSTINTPKILNEKFSDILFNRYQIRFKAFQNDEKNFTDYRKDWCDIFLCARNVLKHSGIITEEFGLLFTYS